MKKGLELKSVILQKKLIPHKFCRLLNIKYASYYVTIVYIVAKLAFLANSIFQIALMKRYDLLNTNSSKIGMCCNLVRQRNDFY